MVRTGLDFISCAFVFRSDYSRGHKRKIRYRAGYLRKDPVTYGGRTRSRFSFSLRPTVSVVVSTRLPDFSLRPAVLASSLLVCRRPADAFDPSLLGSRSIVDELLHTIGRKFTRIRRFLSGRTLRTDRTLTSERASHSTLD